MRGVYQALLDQLSHAPGGHHQKIQKDVAVKVDTTSVRFWWTNSAFFSPPHIKSHIDGCTPRNCFFLGGYYLADLGSFFMGAEEFARSAVSSMQKLTGQYPGVDMTWHLPHAIQPSKSKQPYDIVNSWAAQRSFRRELLGEFSALGEENRVYLLDPFEMTAARLEATVDGNHYNNAINFMKLEMWLNRVCR